MSYFKQQKANDALQKELLDVCRTRPQMERLFGAIEEFVDAKCDDLYDRIKQTGDHDPDY